MGFEFEIGPASYDDNYKYLLTYKSKLRHGQDENQLVKYTIFCKGIDLMKPTPLAPMYKFSNNGSRMMPFNQAIN